MQVDRNTFEVRFKKYLRYIPRIAKIIIFLITYCVHFVDITHADKEVGNAYTNERINILDNKIDILTQDIQHLLNRIENLEHNITRNSSDNNSANKDCTTNPEDIQKKIEFHQNRNASTNITKNNYTYDKMNSNQTRTDQEFYDITLAQLKSGNYIEAAQSFSEFPTKYKNSKLIPNACFWYAETSFKRRDFNESARLFLECYKKYPKSDKSLESLLKLSISLAESGKKQNACIILNKLSMDVQNKPTSIVKRVNESIAKYECMRNKKHR